MTTYTDEYVKGLIRGLTDALAEAKKDYNLQQSRYDLFVDNRIKRDHRIGKQLDRLVELGRDKDTPNSTKLFLSDIESRIRKELN